MKPTKTWILVADGGRARILEVAGKGKVLRMISGSDAKLDNPPSHEQGRDRPARVHELVGNVRHAVEPRHDPHRARETLFARQLGAMLGGYAARNDFDRLVLVAPAAMLGDLRRALQPQVLEKVVAEVDKDLTKIPTHNVLAHINDVLVGTRCNGA